MSCKLVNICRMSWIIMILALIMVSEWHFTFKIITETNENFLSFFADRTMWHKHYVLERTMAKIFCLADRRKKCHTEMQIGHFIFRSFGDIRICALQILVSMINGSQCCKDHFGTKTSFCPNLQILPCSSEPYPRIFNINFLRIEPSLWLVQ